MTENQNNPPKGGLPSIGFIGWGTDSEALLKTLENQYPGIGDASPILLLGDSAEAPPLPVSPTVEALFGDCDFIFLAPPFQATEPLLPMMRLTISDRHILVLLGREWGLNAMLNQLHERKLVRCMISTFQHAENTLLAFHATPFLTEKDLSAFRTLFTQIEMVMELNDEPQFEATLGLAGFAPAVFYTIMDALADGALMRGLSRSEALKLIASLLQGSTRSMLEGEKSPALLREEALTYKVAASGLMELESAGIRGLIMRALHRGLNEITPSPTSNKQGK